MNETNRKPNVIWIFGDQHRAQSLGIHGDPNLRTPVIDNLARNGRDFSCAVSGAPWCSPFRGALLSGKYPHQNGVVRTPGSLGASQPTVAEPFKLNGYHTAYVGKWHLGHGYEQDGVVAPEARGGFDFWQGYENNNNQEHCHVHGSENSRPERLEGYETDALTDIFIRHLESHTGDGEDYDPFFAVLSVQPPHNPYCPPKNCPYGPPLSPAEVELRRNVPGIPWVEKKARQDIAGYCGMIENLDWNIGRVQQALKRNGSDRDTYIVFFSDHGDMLGSHGQWEKSAPWEESIRIPFIISHARGSAALPVGECDAVVNHVDIAPTSLGLCGIKPPEWMAGYDYSGNCAFAENGWSPRSPSEDEPESAYLQQIPRKFHPLCPNKAWRGVAMRDGWKYVCTPGNDWLLYNTREDAYEIGNFVHNAHFQSVRARCWDALKGWIERTGDDFLLPERDFPT
jgi:arylsulfatase A-like enzyme